MRVYREPQQVAQPEMGHLLLEFVCQTKTARGAKTAAKVAKTAKRAPLRQKIMDTGKSQ